MKKCTFCNAEMPEDAVKCEFCGQDAPEEAVQAAEQAEEAVAVAEATEEAVAEAAEEAVAEAADPISALVGEEHSLEQETPTAEPEPASAPPRAFTPDTEPENKKDDIMSIEPEIPSAKPVKARRKNSVGAMILCVFLAIGVFIFSLVGSAFAMVTQVFSKNTFEAVAESVEIKQILDMEIEGATVYDKIEEIAAKEGHSISKEDIEEIADELDLDDTFADVLDQITKLATGESTEMSIDTDSIIDMLEDNRELIKEKTGYEITRENLREIEDVLQENAEEINKTATEMFSQTNTTVTTAVKIALSPVIPIIMFGIVALFVVIMLCVLRKKETTLMFVGIPALLVGLIYSAAYFCSGIATKYAFGMLEIEEYIKNIVNQVLSALLNHVMWGGLIAIGIGVLFIVLYAVICAVARKKRRSYAA